MTDDMLTTTHAGRSRLFPALAVVAVAVATLAAGCGDESDGSAADNPTSATASTSTSTSPSASDSSSPSASTSATPTTEPTAEPTIDPAIRTALKAALKAKYPALVPTGLPEGWAVADAAYSAKGSGSWTLDLTDENGAPVLLRQSADSPGRLATANLPGATRGGKVDLGSYGIGSWQVYAGGAQTGITHKFPSTGAIVVAADQEHAVSFAQTLLVAEDGNISEAG